MDELQLARQEINAADEEMARLFEKRMEAARKIAAYKKEHGLPVFDEVREKQVLESGAERVEDDELRGYYTEFLRDVMTVSKQFQSRLVEGMKIAYCGAPGAFACLCGGKCGLCGAGMLGRRRPGGGHGGQYQAVGQPFESLCRRGKRRVRCGGSAA